MADPVPNEAPRAGPTMPTGMGEGLRLVGRASGVGISAGCLTAIGTLLALFLGLWLDRQLGTRPMFTLGLVLASVPVTLILMTWWVLREARRISASQGSLGGPPAGSGGAQEGK
ncbi:MAG TPA: AtpZ/AtpI family protein [Anaerolineales bacterium]|nr:AtpZ/AtpI family protein [Anaerolineales bacterium]